MISLRGVLLLDSLSLQEDSQEGSAIEKKEEKGTVAEEEEEVATREDIV